jgi:hypothetical protein
MPNILNIGITWMMPELRLKEINELPGLWKPPTPYKCEFAKSVHNAGRKKEVIYKLLSQFRINPNYKFFRVSMEEVRTIFDLMDGDYWGCDNQNGNVESGDVESGDIYDIPRETTNDMDIDNILEKKNREIEKLNEIFQKREIEIKATEEKMLDCLFKKCDDLAANIEDKKADLAEINAIIEERKSELTNLSLIATTVTTDSNTQTNSVNPVNHMITEY